MIKSTKVSLKFANVGKLEQLEKFRKEFRRVASLYLDVLWEQQDLPKFIQIDLIKDLDTWLSACTLQMIGKQVSGIIRGVRQKDNERKFVLAKLIKEGKPTERLQQTIDRNPVGKPEISKINPEFDYRFAKIHLESYQNSFDGHVHLWCLGNKMVLNIPFKRTKHLNKLDQLGRIRPCMRLTDTGMVLMFEIPEIPKKQTGTTLGIDVGIPSILSCSNGKQFGTLTPILNKMKRKKRGSKAFKRCQVERTNLINQTVNELDLTDVQEMRIENIKQLRYKAKNVPRFLKGFTYPDIAEKLESYCETNGVRVEQIDPTYTSQRCSKCGWTQKANRSGRKFVCKACNFMCDADINAAKNIACELPKISWKFRSQHNNLKGFWLHEGKAPIVPSVQKTDRVKIAQISIL